MKITAEISNRHIHLNKEDLKLLFGEGYELEVLKPIHQPGQFASTETVTIKTEKDSISKVRIVGPIRKYTQVEVSKTDAFKLGLNPPVRASGDIKDSSSITVVGPKGEIKLTEGCIIADRHIHINPEEVMEYGLAGKDKVSVLIGGEKGGILHNVRLKVLPKEESYFELHLDTDDANAHMLKSGDMVEIIND